MNSSGLSVAPCLPAPRACLTIGCWCRCLAAGSKRARPGSGSAADLEQLQQAAAAKRALANQAEGDEEAAREEAANLSALRQRLREAEATAEAAAGRTPATMQALADASSQVSLDNLLPLVPLVGRPLGAVLAAHGLDRFEPLRVYLDVDAKPVKTVKPGQFAYTGGFGHIVAEGEGVEVGWGWG